MYRVRLKSSYDCLEWLYGSLTGLYDIEGEIMEKVVQSITSVLLITVSCVLYIVTDKAKSLQADLTSYEQLIAECEKNIPRNKTCKLVAVEESE